MFYSQFFRLHWTPSGYSYRCQVTAKEESASGWTTPKSSIEFRYHLLIFTLKCVGDRISMSAGRCIEKSTSISLFSWKSRRFSASNFPLLVPIAQMRIHTVQSKLKTRKFHNKAFIQVADHGQHFSFTLIQGCH